LHGSISDKEEDFWHMRWYLQALPLPLKSQEGEFVQQFGEHMPCDFHRFVTK